ncbi:MAG: T9SS type A sorting domain-containing protein [Flavobacteriales bacterium]|nr:T9SS type A sorting domain-containing protein [Flavobacteriales bacterium]
MKYLTTILLSFLGLHLTAQTLVSVNPDTINAGQTLNVTITGSNTNFGTASETLDFISSKVDIISFSANSATSMTASVLVDPNAFTGHYDLYYWNQLDGYVDLVDAIYVNGIPAPQIVSVDPDTGNAGQTLNVDISGTNTHFTHASGTTVEFGFGIASSTVNSISITNDSFLTANVTIPPNTFTGDYDVSIHNYIDGKVDLFDGFHVNGIQAPQIVNVNPDFGSPGQTLDVTITGSGTHFAQASNTVIGFEFSQGSSTVVNSTTINSDTEVLVNITIPSSTVFGQYYVSASNAIDGFLIEFDRFTVGTVSVPKHSKEVLSKIYPNPASEQLTIEIERDQLENTFVELIDVQGRLISSWRPKSHIDQLDIVELPSGIYIINVNKLGYIESHKFIKRD